MGKFVDLKGKKFSRLTVVSRVPNGIYSSASWNCLCTCGCSTIVYSHALLSGGTQSCGCYNQEQILKRKSAFKHGDASNGVVSKEYRIWAHMRERCHNPKDYGYKNYGARGICVCLHWRNSFSNFLAAMGRCPEGSTLERKDNDGNYEPGNCIWASYKIQGRNKRNNRLVVFAGRIQPLSAWTEELGLNYKNTWGRLYVHGWSIERAFTYNVCGIDKK